MPIKKSDDDWFIIFLVIFALITGVGAVAVTQAVISEERAGTGGQSMTSTTYDISLRASSGASNSTSTTYSVRMIS